VILFHYPGDTSIRLLVSLAVGYAIYENMPETP
jgi:hypothetical protein